MSRIAAVIQARMGSTRLPGKMLMPIAGAPLLWHVIHRLRKSRAITDICVATTAASRDDPLAEAAARMGAIVVRGPEENVLARFALAAAALDPDYLVRVCGDAPLIDAALIDHMLETLIARAADFVTLPGDTDCIHEGADCFSRRALSLMLLEAVDDPLAREHVTAWLKAHPERVRVAVAPAVPALAFRGARVSIDAPADLAFIRAVYDTLGAQAGEASLSDLVALLRRDPALLGLNAHVRQKRPEAASGTVLIRADGGAGCGFGHVRRCLSVARHLRDECGFGVRFLSTADAAAAAMIRAEGFPLELPQAGRGEAAWIDAAIAACGARAVVLDVRTALPPAALAAWSTQGVLSVLIDDAGPRLAAADLAFLPHGAPAEAGRVHVGFEVVPLGFTAPPATPRPEGEALRVVVALGGADPWGWTEDVVAALSAVPVRHALSVVLGPGVAAPDRVAAAVRALRPGAQIHHAPPAPEQLFAAADVAVVAYGVSALECAALGVPAVLLAPTADQARSAARLAATGAALALAHTERAPAAEIAAAVGRLLGDAALRARMAVSGKRAVDGRGAQRIASLITERLAAAPALSRRA